MLTNTDIIEEKNRKRSLLIDLGIIFIFLPLTFPLFMLFGKYINNNSTFLSIIFLSIIQFCGAGLGAFVVIFIRKESLREYGINKDGLKRSLGISLLFIAVMVLVKTIDAGDILYFPMRNHTAMKYSLSLLFPLNFVGIIITLITWGIIEGFYYVVISKKIDDLFTQNKKTWLTLAPIIFFIYNYIIHYCIRVLVERRTYEFSLIDILLGILLAYSMLIPRKVTGNSWGSLIYQTLQNGLGKI